VAAICTGKGENQGNSTNLVVCYPEMNLQMAKELMVQHGFQQLPVVTRNGTQWQYHKLVGLLDGDGIMRCVKLEASKRIAAAQKAKDNEEHGPVFDSH
jgi:predicted transcriptional regulator